MRPMEKKQMARREMAKKQTGKRKMEKRRTEKKRMERNTKILLRQSKNKPILGWLILKQQFLIQLWIRRLLTESWTKPGAFENSYRSLYKYFNLMSISTKLLKHR